MADIRKQIEETIKEAESAGPNSTTYIVDLDNVDGKRWAVVFGWVDYSGDGKYELCGKVAYNDSYMKDYDYDWIMPYDEETGEVWDTEVAITPNDDFTIDWWLDQWEEIKKIYVYPEEDYDEDIESSTRTKSKKVMASDDYYAGYRTAIVDEKGWPMFWCDELQGWDQIETILMGHPEWSVIAIEQ